MSSCVRLNSGKPQATRRRADCPNGQLIKVHAHGDGSLGIEFGEREWLLVLGTEQMEQIDRERAKAVKS